MSVSYRIPLPDHPAARLERSVQATRATFYTHRVVSSVLPAAQSICVNEYTPQKGLACAVSLPVAATSNVLCYILRLGLLFAALARNANWCIAKICIFETGRALARSLILAPTRRAKLCILHLEYHHVPKFAIAPTLLAPNCICIRAKLHVVAVRSATILHAALHTQRNGKYVRRAVHAFVSSVQTFIL
jgi:hypothetical protein